MPTTTEQDATSGALLSNGNVARLMTIIQDQDFAQTRALADALQLKDGDGVPLDVSEQALLQQTLADILYFFDELGDGTIQAGEDYSLPRDKEEARERIRLRLGLPAVSLVIAQQKADAARVSRILRTSSSVPTQTVYTERN